MSGTYQSLSHSRWDCKYHKVTPTLRVNILQERWRASRRVKASRSAGAPQP